MKQQWAVRLQSSARDLLYRGCDDPSDPSRRRITALNNVTGYIGVSVSMVFTAVNAARGRVALAAMLLVATLVMILAFAVGHRLRNIELAAVMGLTAAGAFMLSVLASAEAQPVGIIWAPLFPLLAMVCLGGRRGSILTLIYFLVLALILFVPGVPGVTAAYPLELSGRLVVSVVFASVLAFYYESSSHAAYARLRAEVDVRRRAEVELKASEEQAIRASQAKTDFLATLSHEVRTPLTAIMGLNDMLLSSQLEPAQRRYAELTNNAGRGLIAVMEDILDLSKVEAGKLALQPRPFDLHALAASVVEVQSCLAHNRPIEVKLDWHADAPRLVVGDPNRVRQILTNLMGNALKFTPSGQIILRVEPETTTGGQATAADGQGSATARQATVTLSVEDTGIGLAADQHLAVFEPFTQAPAGRQHGGTGLGLAISRQLVVAMGGEIGVRSSTGQGAVFWLRLTLPLVDSLPVVAAAPVKTFAGRVLVVEDNALNRDVLRAMLERMGCAVETVNNGAEAVTAVAAEFYDLVLMDCQMPVLDGFAATRRIREREAGGRRTPIVAITAFALPEDTQRCAQSGMDGHLIKPLTPERVGEALDRWLDGAEPTHAAG